MKKTKLLISIALLTLLVSGCTTTITSSTSSGSSSEESSESNTSSETSNDNDNEEDNGIYKLGAVDPSTGVYYYFNGEAATTSSSHFLAVTTSFEQAVDVLIEDLDDGGLSLSFTDSENETKYISWSDGTAVDISDEAYPWYWIDTFNGFYNLEDKEDTSGRFLAYYSDNPSFRAYNPTDTYLAYGHVTPYKSEPDSQQVETEPKTEPVVGTLTEGDYLLGLKVDEVNYYFDGTVYKDYYGNANSDISKAVAVTVATYGNGYSLSFTDSNETTQYIYMSESNGHHNFSWAADKAYAWSYDTTYNTLVALDSEGNCYFIGCYGSNIEFSMNEYTYLTGDKSTSNTQYPATLYQIPDNWGEGGDSQDEEDEDEGTYLFGFNVNGTMNYIDGKTVSGYNYEGTYTTDIDSAVKITLEDSETTGEYYLSFKLNKTRYWITIIDNDGHTNLSYATTASPLYWNATYNCWGDNSMSYFLCQNSAYSCLYCSAISQYISSSPIALLYTIEGQEYIADLEGYEFPAPTKITVSGRNSLYIGNTTQLSVSVEPSNAVSDVTWSTSNESYATVSDSGLVTGTGEGTVTITATSIKDTDVSGSIDIVVSQAPEGQEEVKLGTYDFSTKDETFSKANATGGQNYLMSASDLKTTLDTYWTGEDNYANPLSSVDSIAQIFQFFTSGGLEANQNRYDLLKTGSGSDPKNGVINMSLSNTITKVEINQQSWSTSENCTITVNDSSQESASKGVQETLTFDIDESTSLNINFANRCCIFSITLYGYVA